MSNAGKKNISKIAAVLVAVLIAVLAFGGCSRSEDKDKPADSDSVKVSQNAEEPADNGAGKKEYTEEVIDGITFIDGIMIVNKSYSLPEDYEPGIDPEAQDAFEEMKRTAKEDDISLWIQSGFRSYEKQESLYNNYVEKDGKEEADRYSARPGHSEHQTGLAFDVNSLEDAFEYTPEGQWLAQNCWKYGFIIRYPKGKEDVTGYMYEPWHVRYLGTELSEEIHNSGLTLEEYLGIDSVYAD